MDFEPPISAAREIGGRRTTLTLYLTDVDELTGPFQYQDENKTIHTVLGRAGDLVVFDVTRLLHRAMPPKQNERTAVDLVFLSRLPGQKLDIVVAGMNHWPADPFFYKAPKERIELP